MPRKPKKGYFVAGQFVAEGSDLDKELKRELRGGDAPSRTELKKESEDLQQLGTELLELRADLLDPLDLPDKLLDALREVRTITNFEGRRRQMQFIGKLMRRLEPAQHEAIRAALQSQRSGPAQATALLHEAEGWRESLLADDDALGRWCDRHPQTDVQQLRALIRQARKDAQPSPAGQAPRHGKAYRELFQLVRAQLTPAADTTNDGSIDLPAAPY